MKSPLFFGLHAKPPLAVKRILMVLPFILLIGLYLYASHIRLADNPQDKLLPSVSSMFDGMSRMAFEEGNRSGDILLWKDTFSSLKHLIYGVSLALLSALMLGLYMGLYRVSGFTTLFHDFYQQYHQLFDHK